MEVHLRWMRLEVKIYFEEWSSAMSMAFVCLHAEHIFGLVESIDSFVYYA